MVVSCPELHGSEPGPGKEGRERARRHERMVAIVTGFCPDVEVVKPGVCAFGARGPSRYFGGEAALADRIIAALADPGTGSRGSSAATAGPGVAAGGSSVQARVGSGVQAGSGSG